MDTEVLIKEVFARPGLWDKKNNNHHNIFVLEKLWEEVAVEMKTTPIAARKRWKSLRDKFRTTFTAIPKTKAGDAQFAYNMHEWRYFRSLLFLKDQFSARKSSGNSVEDTFEGLLNDADDEGEKEMKFVLPPQEIYDGCRQDFTPCSSRASTFDENPPKAKRSKQDSLGDALLQIEMEKLNYLKEQELHKQDDEDLSFFNSLLPAVRKFSTVDKLDYRMMILQVTRNFLTKTETDTVGAAAAPVFDDIL
ncbi:PREDICTED: uncharacterized protein LOC108359684 [Rhagoletis zephyria]|uniref:uncharacterized protein LOC108359684 n=1 Tax=Rhagoletis zephyria TaxID=28612 RepID=UPI0008118B1E|nr:PREDICTED: uncharacterized protein LOC108359684 [Rhagoletis zephyria]